MRRNEARPEGTLVSDYFFSHLSGPVSSAHENEEEESTNVPAPRALTKATGATIIDGVLWERFTPEGYRTQALALAEAEQRASAALERELSAAWARVEEVMARNKQRRAVLESAALDQAVLPVADALFWTADEVAQRFGLETNVGGEAATAIASPSPLTDAGAGEKATTSVLHPHARITLDFSVLAARPIVESSAAAGSDAISSDEDEMPPSVNAGVGSMAGLGQHHTRAYTVSEETLLDPTRRPHCLRRLFTGMLHRRDALPRNTALLMQDVQQVQAKELPALEALLERVSVMFHVPLHIPFRAIAHVLSRELCKPTTIGALEDQTVARLKLGEQFVKELDAYVREHTADPAALEMLSLEEKVALADGMWRRLFAELDSHRSLHSDGLHGYEDLTRMAEENKTSLSKSLDDCDAESRAALLQLMRDADSCAEAVRRSQERTLSLLSEMDAAFDADRSRLQAAIQRKAHTVARSEATQEKLARRVREAVKELYTEQVRYEEAVQELLRDRLSLAQLEASHNQLHHSFSARQEQAKQVGAHMSDLTELLRQAEGARQALVTACRQHTSRVAHEDYYRRCRVMSRVVTNVQGWSRCVQDVGHLYEARFAALEGKSKASWQLTYLVAGERDWAAGNLLDLRPEAAEVRTRWAELQPLMEPLDLSEEGQRLSLDGGSGSSASTEGRHARMVLLDGPPAVQRKTVTLAQHRKQQQQQQQQAADAEPAKELADNMAANASGSLRVSSRVAADVTNAAVPTTASICVSSTT